MDHIVRSMMFYKQGVEEILKHLTISLLQAQVIFIGGEVYSS